MHKSHLLRLKKKGNDWNKSHKKENYDKQTNKKANVKNVQDDTISYRIVSHRIASPTLTERKR